MTAIEIINVIYQSMFIFIFVITTIALAVYAAKSVFNKEAEEAEAAEAEWKAACEADDKFMKSIEAKLDLLLKLHGCDVCEDSIIRPTHNVDEKLTEISDKLAVLLCGPLDEETLKELRAEREANKE